MQLGTSRAPRRRPLAVLAAALVGASVLLAAPARAEEADEASAPVASTTTTSADSSAETVTGEVSRVYADPGPDLVDAEESGGGDEEVESDPITYVTPDDGDPVRVESEPLADVPAGATVAVSLGATTAEATYDASLEPARAVEDTEVLAEADPSATTTATNAITVVPVVPAGVSSAKLASGSVTATKLQTTLDGAVATYWSEQTQGAVRFTAAAYSSWVHTTAGCDDPYGMWTEAAARAGWTAGSGKHLMLYLPAAAYTSAGCAYGLGTVGADLHDGGFSYVTAAGTDVMAHELGHNLGLGHASEFQCDGSADTGSVSAGSCRVSSYYDLYDVMGASWGQAGALNAVQAAELGVLPSAQEASFTAATGSASYTLAPIEDSSGVRALTVTTATGAVYSVEFRQATGRDSWLASSSTNQFGLDTGITVHRTASTGGDDSYLLDATPSATSGWNADLQTGLAVGAHLALDGGVTLTVTSQTSTAAVVQVVQGATPIAARYAALGGSSSVLGAVVSAEQCGLATAGCRQQFANGWIYWTQSTGARAVTGAIAAKWRKLGAETSTQGYPTGNPVCGLPAGGCRQAFSGGRIYWSPATGAHPVQGKVLNRWAKSGYQSGSLGYPTADAVCGLVKSGCTQSFAGGAVISSTLGTYVSSGKVLAKWRALGASTSALGYPTGSLTCGLKAGGCVQVFSAGRIYWSTKTGAHPVTGKVLAKYRSKHYQRGSLGYPTADPKKSGKKTTQKFQHGTLTS